MEAVASSLSPGPGPNGATSAPFATVDPARVVDHVTILLEAALGATRAELDADGSLLCPARYQDTLQRCARFADAQVALYIQKDLAPTTSLDDGSADEGRTAAPRFLGPTRVDANVFILFV